MRRRALLTTAAAGAAGLSGCRGLPLRSGDGPLRFTGVDTQTRKRCQRVLDRVTSLVEAELSEPITVRYVSPDSSQQTRLGVPYSQFAFATPGSKLSAPSSASVPAGSFGQYDADERTLSLARPEDVPATLFEDLDTVPTVSLETYPSEPFLAHELAHAVQNDVAASPSLPDGHDRRLGQRGVVEGTAEYVGRRYRRQCTDGTYESCATRSRSLSTPDVPLWLVPGRLPYVNGTAFVHAALRRGGWDRVWAACRDPPDSAAAIMFPEAAFEGTRDWQTAAAHPQEIGEWRRMWSSRAGVNPLYVYLRALGVVAATAEGAAATERLSTATGTDALFRATLLREWRGDRLTLYSNPDGRVGHYWTTTWRSADSAERVATAARRRYDADATPSGEVWKTDQQFVSVTRAGDTVSFAMGPSRSGLRQIRQRG